MSQVTFVTFSANDLEDEVDRNKLFIRSMLKQDLDNWRLIFWDMSPANKRFDVPQDKRITQIQQELSIDEWNPAWIRNKLALMVETDIVCHVNADCHYAHSFCKTIIDRMTEDKLLLCRRYELSKEQWDRRVTIGGDLLQDLGMSSPAVVGECQCMWTETFIKIGGYRQLIKNGELQPCDWKLGCKEDSDLCNYVRRQHGHEKVKHNIKEEWLEETWLVHLWHPRRYNKKVWCAANSK